MSTQNTHANTLVPAQSDTLRIVAVTGSPQRPSRTVTLAEHILQALGETLPIQVRHITLGDLTPWLADTLDPRGPFPDAVQESIHAIENADALLVATPVYRATYPGLFKHLFDLVHHESLIDKPVLLAATGGSDRHALVIEHQLRPLFSFFQAQTLPIGVYAAEADFDGYTLQSPALRERIALAAQRAAPVLAAILWQRQAKHTEPALRSHQVHQTASPVVENCGTKNARPERRQAA